MKKLFWLLLVFAGCTSPKSLHQSGTYTITSVSSNVVTFRGITGSYQLPADTLKVGDTIRMNVIRISKGRRQ